jgi:type IV pilus assembly protein PilC
MAANESDLGARLSEGGMALVDCKELSEKAGKLAALTLRKVKIREMIQMFVQLEQLNRAGVPLLASLADVRDTTESTLLRDIMTDVHREVAEGSSFSAALAKHPATFEPIFVALVNAGEETGNLSNAFEQVIKHLKWTDAMRSKIKKATRYPKILIAVVMGVIWMMLGYVVPQVTGFLNEMGHELPPVTVALIATSDFFSAYFVYILAALIGSYVFVILARNMSETFRYRTDYIALNSPVFGPLIRKISLSQFSSTLGVLFISGIDILKCLDAAKLTAGNLVIVEALTLVRTQVQEGATLSAAMTLSGEFPSLVIRMIKIGEESGNLTGVLQQVSEFYDKDVNEAVDGMIMMIEPTLTVILGSMIVWIAAAVFGPIYDSIGSMGK